MNADLVGAYHSKVKLCIMIYVGVKLPVSFGWKSDRCFDAQRFEMGDRYFFAVFVAALKLVHRIQKQSK